MEGLRKGKKGENKNPLKWREDRATCRKDIEIFVRRYFLKLILINLPVLIKRRILRQIQSEPNCIKK